jgi:hypothetical protein
MATEHATLARRCAGCERQVHPEEGHSWSVGGLVPVGTSLLYHCAVCGNKFRVRSTPLMVVLAGALCVLAWIALTDWNFILQRGLGSWLALGAFVGYTIYALIDSFVGRTRNQVWLSSDDSA